MGSDKNAAGASKGSTKLKKTASASKTTKTPPLESSPTQKTSNRVTKTKPLCVKKTASATVDSSIASSATPLTPPPHAPQSLTTSMESTLQLAHTTRSDMVIPDFTTETGTRVTETASSVLDLRTDTTSAQAERNGGLHDSRGLARNGSVSSSSSESLNFEVESEAPLEHVETQPGMTAPQEEKAREAQTATTSSRKAAEKQKLYSDADSSCSENITPRPGAEVEAKETSTATNTTTAATAATGAASHYDDPAASPKTPVLTAPKMLAPKASNATRLAQEYRVGDHAPVIVKGCKFVFDNKDMRWKTHDITVRILHPNRGVDQDNYFAIFSAELLDPVKAAAPMFAKVYRRNIADVAEADYFSLGQAQALCEEFARDYSRQKARGGYTKYRLPLLTNRVVVRLNLKSIMDPAVRNAHKGFFSYRTEDTHQMMCFMEPNTLACAAVGASFTSAEVDEGKCYPHGDPAWPKTVYSDIADGLSHFSYVQSRERMLMHGFLRSNGYLLDPLFHTTDREGFRMGDGGKKAMVEWIKQHRCGDTCRALGLRSDRTDIVDVSAAAAFNPLVSQENHYTEYLRCVRQMRVVVRIAIESPEPTDEDEMDDFDSVSPTTESVASTQNVRHAMPLASTMFPVTLNAVKYVFLPARARWEEVPMRITVLTPNKPDKLDDRNACFSIHEGAEGIPMRAKFILRPGAKDADYYHVGDAYCVCVALSQVFRGYRKSGAFERELDFRSAYAVRVPQAEIPESVKAHISQNSFFSHVTADSGDIMFVLEPEFTSDVPQRAPGVKRMPKDAEGFDDPELRQVVDAFSHFTLHKSGNHLLVCSLKCKDGLLTRPHINTSNARGFETINDGERGIRHWIKHHTCNAICQHIGLEPLPPRLKLYNISNSKLMNYINLVQQHALGADETVDFNLPSRPPSEMISRQVSAQKRTTASPALALPVPSEERKMSTASPAESNHSNGASMTVTTTPVVSPNKEDSEPLLRPWVHTGKGAIPNHPPKRNGVLASGPRRPLTQADLMRLESRGIDTKYVLPATKYEYNVTTQSWTALRIFVRVVAPERGIGQGGMRVCFEVTNLDPEEAEETVWVAKMYRRTIKDVVEKDYFTEVAVQKLCSLFAKDFNQETKEGCDVRLNVLEGAVIAIERADLNPELLAKRTGFFSYRTTDSQRLMFSVEPRLAGRFTKYNGNMGEAYPTNESRLSPVMARERTKIFEAVEALSHYSLVKSEGGLLVCDMQGVKNDLTDLEVHTYDGKGLGIGNFGARGIEKFIERHRCTPVCKALHLAPLHDQKFEVTEDVKKNNPFVKIFERSKAIEQAP